MQRAFHAFYRQESGVRTEFNAQVIGISTLEAGAVANQRDGSRGQLPFAVELP